MFVFGVWVDLSCLLKRATNKEIIIRIVRVARFKIILAENILMSFFKKSFPSEGIESSR